MKNEVSTAETYNQTHQKIKPVISLPLLYQFVCIRLWGLEINLQSQVSYQQGLWLWHLDGEQKKGTITYNGHTLDEFVPQKTSVYISQNDLHVGELTVRETLDFSARCQGVGTRYGKRALNLCTSCCVAFRSLFDAEASIAPESVVYYLLPWHHVQSLSMCRNARGVGKTRKASRNISWERCGHFYEGN